MKFDENGFLEPKKSTLVRSSDDGAVTYIAVYRRAEVDHYLGESAETFNHPRRSLGEFLTGLREFYKGPGRAFGYAPIATVGKFNVVVRQYRGMDI